MTLFMIRTLLSALTLMLFVGCAGTGAQQGKATAPDTPRLVSVDYAPFPDLDTAYAKGVSGHFVLTDTLGGHLVIGGGCNFPERPVYDGGTKRYYADIYAITLSSEDETSQAPTIRRLGSLTTPLAYAGATEKRIFGGESSAGDVNLIHSIHALHSTSPDIPAITLDTIRLPETWAAGGVASSLTVGVHAVTSRSYLVGGRFAGKLSNRVLCLEESYPPHASSSQGSAVSSTSSENQSLPIQGEGYSYRFRELPPYPGKPLLKVLAWADLSPEGAECLYMIGSFADTDTDTPASASLVGYQYHDGAWHDLPLPEGLDGVTFGGGSITRLSDGTFVLGGGVHSERFVPALQRGQAMARARAEGDTHALDSLQAEHRRYLMHPEEWYHFTPTAWRFTPRADSPWSVWGTHPDLARADAVWLTHPDEEGAIIVVGGELKPGIRTPSIRLVSQDKGTPSSSPQSADRLKR